MAGNQTIYTAREMLATARDSGDQRGEAEALLELGRGYAASGLAVEATTAFENAGEVARMLGDRALAAKALGNAGSQLHQAGQFDDALEFSLRAVEEFRAIGDEAAELRTLANCAVICRAIGQPDEALGHVDAALSLAKLINEQPLTVGLAGLRSELLIELGRGPEARAARQQMVSAARKSKDPAALVGALEGLGECQLLDGLHSESLRTYFEANELYRKHNHLDGQYRISLQLGLVYQHLMRWTEAEASLETALDLCLQATDSQRLPYIQASLASAKLELGQYGSAADLARSAGVAYQRVGDPIGEGRALATLGQAMDGLGDYNGARSAWEAGLRLLDPVDDVGANALRQFLAS